jgi:hypothetical protein
MYCYAIYYGAKQVRVFPHEITGIDWHRAEALAIDFARKARHEWQVPDVTIEHFDCSGVGSTVRF